MTTTTIAARRLAGALGAEIIGVDLARPTPELAEALQRLRLEHHALLFTSLAEAERLVRSMRERVAEVERDRSSMGLDVLIDLDRGMDGWAGTWNGAWSWAPRTSRWPCNDWTGCGSAACSRRSLRPSHGPAASGGCAPPAAARWRHRPVRAHPPPRSR